METNTTFSGPVSFLASYDAAGARQDTVVETTVFAGGFYPIALLRWRQSREPGPTTGGG